MDPVNPTTEHVVRAEIVTDTSCRGRFGNHVLPLEEVVAEERLEIDMVRDPNAARDATLDGSMILSYVIICKAG